VPAHVERDRHDRAGFADLLHESLYGRADLQTAGQLRAELEPPRLAERWRPADLRQQLHRQAPAGDRPCALHAGRAAEPHPGRGRDLSERAAIKRNDGGGAWLRPRFLFGGDDLPGGSCNVGYTTGVKRWLDWG